MNALQRTVAPLQNWIRAAVLSRTTRRDLLLALGRKVSDIFSFTKPKATRPMAKELKDWEIALAAATNPDEPNRILLYDLYTSLLYDTHLASVIDTRILRIKLSKFNLVNESGEPDEEMTALFEASWFYQFLGFLMETLFWGAGLVEVYELADDGRIKTMKLVPRKHVRFHTGIVVKEQDDDAGISFRDGKVANWVIVTGDEDYLGLLKDIAPVVLMKKYALAGWDTYNERTAVPFSWVKSPNADTGRLDEIADMLANRGQDGWGILHENETFEYLTDPGSNRHMTFDAILSKLNSEISKRVLGQDGTTDNKDAKGTYGSLQVMAGVAEDRHASDKQFVRFFINDTLLPFLAMHGYNTTGLRFVWNESKELAPSEAADLAAKLAPHFKLDHEELSKLIGLTLSPKESIPAADPVGFNK